MCSYICSEKPLCRHISAGRPRPADMCLHNVLFIHICNYTWDFLVRYWLATRILIIKPKPRCREGVSLGGQIKKRGLGRCFGVRNGKFEKSGWYWQQHTLLLSISTATNVVDADINFNKILCSRYLKTTFGSAHRKKISSAARGRTGLYPDRIWIFGANSSAQQLQPSLLHSTPHVMLGLFYCF